MILSCHFGISDCLLNGTVYNHPLLGSYQSSIVGYVLKIGKYEYEELFGHVDYCFRINLTASDKTFVPLETEFKKLN